MIFLSESISVWGCIYSNAYVGTLTSLVTSTGLYPTMRIPKCCSMFCNVFLVLGALIFSIKNSNTGAIKWKSYFNVTILLVLITSLGYNLQYVLSKFVIEQSNIYSVFVITQTTYLFLSLIIAQIATRGKVVKNIMHLSKGFILMAVAGEGVGILAYIMYTTAFMSGSLALVTALASTQCIFVILLGYLLTRLYPSFLSERWDKNTTIQKIIGITFIIVGVIGMYYVT